MKGDSGRVMRSVTAGASVIALLLLAGGRSPLRAQLFAVDDSLEIASVSFPGATAFPDRILTAAVVTQPTRCTAIAPLCLLGVGMDRQYLDPIEYQRDPSRLFLFYARQGYREVQVSADTVRKGRRLHVDFRIDEGEPIRVDSIAFDSDGEIPRDATRNLPLIRGSPLSEILLEASRDSLRFRLADRGYAQVEVLTSYNVPTGSHAASVSFLVIPGPHSRFGEIEVIGAEKVDSSVVRRMLTFRPGDVFSRTQILNSQRNLFAQEVFRHAEIRALPTGASDSIVAVRVQVNEGDLHRVRTGLGMSSAEYLNAEVRWISRSFQGGARRLELRGAISNVFANMLEGVPPFLRADPFYTGNPAGSLSADFTQPWFFGPLNTFGAGLFYDKQSIPGVFIRESLGGSLTLTRSLTHGSVSLAYRPELTRLDTKSGDLIFCANFTACGPEEVAALTKRNWLAPVAASFIHDRSNSLFAPTRGYSIRLDGEVATPFTGSDFSYTRMAAELIDYHTFLPGWIWALRLKPGIAHPLTFGNQTGLGVNPQKRFFEGGPNSVRGFAQYQLGPKLLTVSARRWLALPARPPGSSAGTDSGAGCSPQSINDGSCDARAFANAEPGRFESRPVGGEVSLVGNVEVRFPVLGDRLRGAAFVDYGQVWETTSGVKLADMIATPGLGVRYFSPIGPIRVDVGYYTGRGQTLTVVTNQVCIIDAATGDCTPPVVGVNYDYNLIRDTNLLEILDTPVQWNPRRNFLQRLQLHFSIGQAF
jgi:outer membrane protein insertion porin family